MIRMTAVDITARNVGSTLTNIAGVPIPTSHISTAVRVMLDGYKVNGGRGLSDLQFCEAQISYLLENKISPNHPLVDQYRIEADKERMKL